ncbi:MAG TPA: hypothetical protein VIS49_14430, partial [Cyclobacteriaceae bacterium]
GAINSELYTPSTMRNAAFNSLVGSTGALVVSWLAVESFLHDNDILINRKRKLDLIRNNFYPF